MTDERQHGLLFESWLKGTDPTPPDASRSVAEVMANVPQTRQRGRWWPLPAFDRQRPTFPSREPAPAPIPATNGPRPARGFTMFSALKFVVAVAIVALFGGFLLTGILTTQQEGEVLPAAVTESPSPMTTEELLSGMVTEEVEPGVSRVIDDGYRDLTSVEAVDIVAGYDDSVWLVREEGVVALGSDETHQWPLSPLWDHAFEVAPDGTMWAIPCGTGWWPEGCGDVLRSTDGEEWTTLPSCPLGSTRCGLSTVAPDGTAWGSWKEEGGYRVGYLGATGWQPLDGYARSNQWRNNRAYRRIFITDAGDIYGMEVSDIYRFGDRGWEFFSKQPLIGHNGALVDVGRDGTVWLGNVNGLTRYADGEWEYWPTADVLGTDYDIHYYDNARDRDYVEETSFEVAPDGSLWYSPWQRCSAESSTSTWCCDGLVRFDGETLDRFLPGRCISMDIAADGSVWVLAAEETLWDRELDYDGDMQWVLAAGEEGRRTYVITPVAAAASE